MLQNLYANAWPQLYLFMYVVFSQTVNLYQVSLITKYTYIQNVLLSSQQHIVLKILMSRTLVFFSSRYYISETFYPNSINRLFLYPSAQVIQKATHRVACDSQVTVRTHPLNSFNMVINIFWGIICLLISKTIFSYFKNNSPYYTSFKTYQSK